MVLQSSLVFGVPQRKNAADSHPLAVIVLGDLLPFHLRKKRLWDVQGDAGESRSPGLSTLWQEKPIHCQQQGFVSLSQYFYCEYWRA